MPEALVVREIVENKKDEYLQEADQMEKRVREDATKRFVFTEAGLYFETRKRTRKGNKEEDQEKESNIELAKQLEATGHTREYGGSIRAMVESYSQKQNLLHRDELEEIEERLDQYNILIANSLAQIEELKKKLTMSSAIVLGQVYNNSIHIYNSEAKNWKKCNVRLPFRGQLLGAAILKEELYVFGSIDLFLNTRTTTHYKLDGENEWHVLAEMNEERELTDKSTIVFNEEIWVIGGWSDKTKRILKSVEKYNPDTDSWTLMAELNHARARCAAVVIDKKIYVCGGRNAQESCLKSVEVYDPDENKWEIFCHLPFGLHRHRALADGTNLIILGGYLFANLNHISKEVLKMDISNPTNNWEHLPDLSHNWIYCHGAFKAEEGLMVFSEYLAEMFDGKEWRRKSGSLLPYLYKFATIQLSKKDEELFLRKYCS